MPDLGICYFIGGWGWLDFCLFVGGKCKFFFFWANGKRGKYFRNNVFIGETWLFCSEKGEKACRTTRH